MWISVSISSVLHQLETYLYEIYINKSERKEKLLVYAKATSKRTCIPTHTQVYTIYRKQKQNTIKLKPIRYQTKYTKYHPQQVSNHFFVSFYSNVLPSSSSDMASDGISAVVFTVIILITPITTSCIIIVVSQLPLPPYESHSGRTKTLYHFV